MKKFSPFSMAMLLLPLLFTSCTTKDLSSQAAEEIKTAEAAFAQMAKEKGVPAAFLAFAADDAVLMRNDQIIPKPEMEAYFAKSTLDSVQLSWAPDLVQASRSGDLGYTYGKYQFSARDSTGQPFQAEGIFHTVWKKQADGTWKFVWD